MEKGGGGRVSGEGRVVGKGGGGRVSGEGRGREGKWGREGAGG